MTCATSPSPMTPTRSLVTMCLSTGGAAAAQRVLDGWGSPRGIAAGGSVAGGEGGVERGLRGLDLGEPADEPERVGGADGAVHPGVLPLDADRAGVADGVEHPEDRLPWDVAVTGGDEVPTAPRVRPGQVRAQPAVAAVELLHRLLAVHVVDPVAEVPEEADRVEVLPDEVAGVEVQPEGRPVPDRGHRGDGRPAVVRDLARGDLVREADPDLVEDVEDGIPAPDEVLVAALDHRGRTRREHGHRVPDRGAGEADDRVHAEGRRGPRRGLDLLGGALAHALGLAVAPHPARQDRAVPLVDREITDRLTGEVAGDRVHREPVLGQDLAPLLD